jgi:CRP/FNR family transcriptional regulator, cyclic AMP receptor protein
MVQPAQTLAQIPLFRTLTGDDLDRLDRWCQWSCFGAKSVILGYEHEGTDVYFVVSGTVRVWLPSLRRTDVILSDIGAGEFFGEMAALDGRPRSASVTALTTATVARMPALAFRETIHGHPEVCDQILRLLSARIRLLDLRVVEFSTLPVRDRIRAELLRLGRVRVDQPNEAVISPPPVAAELAARISSHREAVARELKVLERAGLLERRRGALALRNVEALAALVERAAETAG